MMRKTSVLIVLVCSWFFTAKAAVWQWSVTVDSTRGVSRAYLWIPEGCKQVKGLVLAQHNMEEISILENPIFRKEMAKLGFAEIWVSPSPNFLKFYDFSKAAAEVTQAYLDSLAWISGYEEIRTAPVVGIGHSAAASWPYYYAALNPQRTLACLSVSGQWPYVRTTCAPDIWKPDQNIDFIPSLECMGEYEAANTWSKEGLKERSEHPCMPLSMLAVPGEGHFAASDRKVEFLAFYIRKAVQYRYPNDVRKDAALRPVNPVRSGWLADKWHIDRKPDFKAAPVGRYKGDTTQAFWYFDRETAREVERYGKAFRGLKPQLVGFTQQGKMVPQANTHLQINMKFLPDSDGVTFHLKGAFYDTVPAVSNRLAGWTGLPIGSKLEHGDAGKIRIERICGPFTIINDTTFRFELCRGENLAADRYTLTFAVWHPGDGTFKSAVQQGEMVIPARLKEGREQTIYFAPILDQPAGIRTLKLNASSDAGAKVRYFVLEGPAEVQDDVLMFTRIPPGTRFPVRVTVVAWQYGWKHAPALKTAVPVARTFYLTK